MCTLVLVTCDCLEWELVWLRSLTVPTLPWAHLAITVGKRRASVDALVILKTTSCQQPLYYDFVTAALCSTDDLPRKSEAHCYTKRHAKIMLYIQRRDNR